MTDQEIPKQEEPLTVADMTKNQQTAFNQSMMVTLNLLDRVNKLEGYIEGLKKSAQK